MQFFKTLFPLSFVLVSGLVASITLTSTALAAPPPPFRPVPYKVIAPPNVNAPIGVLGIVPQKANMSPVEAADEAAYVRKQIANGKKWTTVQIYVFADMQTGKVFGDYQKKRAAKPLALADYRKLKVLWPKTWAFYENEMGRETVCYPSLAPSNWWETIPNP